VVSAIGYSLVFLIAKQPVERLVPELDFFECEIAKVTAALPYGQPCGYASGFFGVFHAVLPSAFWIAATASR
jgi:hypothetical protein